MLINSTSEIASNISSIEITDNGLNVTIDGNDKLNLKPKLKLKFDSSFRSLHFNKDYLGNTIKHIFKYLFKCGDGIEIVDRGEDVLILNGSANYLNGEIKIPYSLINPLVLVHEVVHAIVERVDPEYDNHIATSENDICSLVNIYANEAPGFMLDIATRLKMQFDTNEVPDLNYVDLYIPSNHGYGSIEEFCAKLNETRLIKIQDEG